MNKTAHSHKKYLQEALELFVAYGSKIIKPKNKRWLFYACPDWIMPHVSPTLIPNDNLTSKDLAAYSKRFKKVPSKYAWEDKNPFVTLFEQGQLKYPKTKKLLRKEKWKEDSNPFFLCVWKQQTSFELPKGYAIQIAADDNKEIYREYEKLEKECFSLDATFIRVMRKALYKSKAKNYFVNIKNQNGKTIATSGVALYKGHALLFGACVLPKYRKKGLWQALLSARLGISSLGTEIKSCYLFTEVQTIYKRAPERYRMRIFRA